MKLLSLLTFAMLFLVSSTYAEEADPGEQLKTLLTKAVADAGNQNEAAVRKICEGLALPKPDVWFATQFGEEKGVKLASQYIDSKVGTEMPKFFFALAEKGQTEVRVTAIRNAEDPEGNGNQRNALSEMKEPIVLYSARFVVPGQPHGMHLYSFGVVEGAPRFLGKMQLR